jgi:mitochondrial chaperone BCS1
MDFSWFENNQFFSGGLVLMVLGGLLMWLKGLPGQLYDFFERFFIVKIEILDEDEAYQWMSVWLAERLNKTLSISVITRRNRPHDNAFPADDDANRPTVYFVPACGTYFFWYKRRFVTLHRDRKENASSSAPMLQAMGNSANSNPMSMMRTKESFTMRIFSRNKDLAHQLIDECRKKALPDDGKIDIRVGTYNYWSLGCRIQARPLESVILDGDIGQDLLKDIKNFQESAPWYQDVGVPWRRSYLLEGPPGNGKTSIVKAIGGELNMHIYMLMLSDPDMTDNRLMDLLAKIGNNSILLMEDIDCAFVKRQRTHADRGLTFSGLLNGIDGVATPEGRIIFMTTNYKDRLDPALIRPGRADVHLHIDNATSLQATRLFSRFFPENKLMAPDFGRLIPERQYSMAALQNYLMLYRNNPVLALRNVEELKQMMVKSQPIQVEEEEEEGEMKKAA